MPALYPTWINHSGLPQLLAQETGGSAAWLLLRTVIDLDCRRAASDPVDTSLANLATITGLTGDQVIATLPAFRETGVAKYYMPEDQDENALIQVISPLPTPLSHRDVIHLQIADPTIAVHRYCTCPEAQAMEPSDPILQEVVDLYLNHCGVRMNSFVIDRLNYLRHRVDIQKIRWAFKTAAKSNTHSLDAVMRIALNLATKEARNK